MNRIRINTAIISVYDKTGIKEFVSELKKINPDIKIISSSGTFREIESAAGENLVDVSEYTGFPEMPSGLVKTLHPKVHGGLLGNDSEQEFMERNSIERIDLVVVNLYPFGKSKGNDFELARTNIDIGGVSLIEAGCKNFLRVSVITDPSDYNGVLALLKANKGSTSLNDRFFLAKKGFLHLSSYVSDISSFFSSANLKNVVDEYEKRL